METGVAGCYPMPAKTWEGRSLTAIVFRTSQPCAGAHTGGAILPQERPQIRRRRSTIPAIWEEHA